MAPWPTGAPSSHSRGSQTIKDLWTPSIHTVWLWQGASVDLFGGGLDMEASVCFITTENHEKQIMITQNMLEVTMLDVHSNEFS